MERGEILDRARVFQARHWILLVAFENRSGNPSLDGTIEAALEHELVNSRFVNVGPRVRVDDVLLRNPNEASSQS